ncbi:PCI-domain-containing protein [Exidia glandulosa HHB12029]|uniref:PCI-domain-containing protein n=1 Tax=Exidia glandulosa HHB12029 TaxID=1314781 RepID=A0A165K948_EXIGL|nr:PCI-domain-containing protein [Exidia glandulosa HHB12029]
MVASDPMATDSIAEGSQEAGWRSQARKSRDPVIVDDAHPFDLDAYISSYTGRTAVARLLHIANVCPSLAQPAYARAVRLLRESREPNTYLNTIAQHNSLSGADHIEPDKKWVDDIHNQNLSDKNKLEVELKAYSSNMIKESIRMAHRDLGDFYRMTSDNSNALKHYTKSREFCTTSQHVLEMCLSVLELLVEQQNYSHISTYIFKAEAALDAIPAQQAAPQGAATTATQSQAPKKSAEREKVQTKLDFCSALAALGVSNYEKAATGFLKLGYKGLEDWFGKLVAPSDIAAYGVLCALATLPRSALVSRLGLSQPGSSKGSSATSEPPPFAYYLEQEQYVRELVDAYVNSKFKTVLELLDRFSSRHILDINLSPHVQELTTMIRDRAIVLYFQPFASIRLDRMALAFGLPADQLEKMVVALIQAGQIKGRVDSQNKILRAKDLDQRVAMFTRAEKVGKAIQSSNHKLLLRIRLMQNDLQVPKPSLKDNKGSSLLGAVPTQMVLE